MRMVVRERRILLRAGRGQLGMQGNLERGYSRIQGHRGRARQCLQQVTEGEEVRWLGYRMRGSLIIDDHVCVRNEK